MREQVRIYILLTIVFAALIIYAMVPQKLTYASIALRKIALTEATPSNEPLPGTTKQPESTAKARERQGTNGKTQGNATNAKQQKASILFFGDSMLEGLARCLDDYAVANGHTMHTVIWYGSTTEKWGMTQTLRTLIDEHHPTYLLLCLGSNELFVRDLPEREAYIKLLLAQIGDLPFVWIGPPNWKEDTGINDIIARNIGQDHFFDSRHLNLQRGKDGRHPTAAAAAHWADLVAEWMQGNNNANPLPMAKPKQQAHCPVKVLQPDFEGYQ